MMMFRSIPHLTARRLTCMLLAACAFAPASSLAQDYARCRAIADNVARLRCFDELDRGAESSAPAPAAPAIAPAPAAKPVLVPAPAAAASPAPAQALPPAAAATEPPVENFGAVALPKKAPAEAKEITAALIGSVDGIFRGMVLPLDNGQTWTVIDDREFEYLGTNPAVKLDRNLIGSYWMKILDGGPRFKVRRIR